MKRLLLVVLAVFLMMPVFASNGDTLNIGGVVPLILNLTVTPAANYDNLTLVGAGADTTATLAGIVIETNNSAGWELWIYSSNFSTDGSCALMNDDDDEVTYTLQYTGTGTAATAAVASADGTQFGGAAVADGANRFDDTGNIVITYDQSVDYPAGYYSDQLTIVLRAK